MNPNSYISPLDDVNTFITELNEVLISDSCDLDILPRKKDEDPTDPFTTENTLQSLNYDSNDVKVELRSLTSQMYLETIKDGKVPSRPPFWVNSIQGKDIYIKVKIRNRNTYKIFCVSFHFARYPFKEMPYR